MLIKKLMTQPIVTVEFDDTLKVLKEIFENVKFHHLLVVEDKKLYGVISDRDLLKATSPFVGTANEKVRDKLTLNRKAHQIMTRKPITLTADANVYDAIAIFNEHSISCIPIVNEHFEPVGIVSWRDILRVIGQNHEKKVNKTHT
ncbi:CBS domain-containing protein [Glaciecola sp. XM2]|uniref:CBS domain-containing protein n=1 Tax=Glaciecola sp. XM2 TaxID=1914931 RepID=UPI001BDDD612|nr:CBS domain-containing protein [Glaciecola sp. XM2]MBT1451844.1 CBS domain-containing protein [Glaciecola sp. XM2]